MFASSHLTIFPQPVGLDSNLSPPIITGKGRCTNGQKACILYGFKCPGENEVALLSPTCASCPGANTLASPWAPVPDRHKCTQKMVLLPLDGMAEYWACDCRQITFDTIIEAFQIAESDICHLSFI